MSVNNSLTSQKNQSSLSAYMSSNSVKNYLNRMIGSENGQRFVAAVISAVNNNPSLQECRNESILSGALLGESLKLSPSPQLGQYYLVPFNDKSKGKVAQFQLGYKGYIQLAIRSGQYKKLNVLEIKETELVKFDPLNEEIEVNLIQDEEEREKAETIGYYAMFEYINGFKKAIYWTKSKMESHAVKYSQSYRSDKNNGNKWSFWSQNFDEMAKKTMLRQLISKWGIMSVEMQTAVTSDMAVIEEDNNITFVENEPDMDIDTTKENDDVVNTVEENDKDTNDVENALFE